MNALTQDQLQSFTLPCGEKTAEMIQNLPERDLTWVVYNANMIQHACMLIIQFRGLEFFDKYVRVISRDCADEAKGELYLDPELHNLIGNGYG
jgi:hypothetical protein